MRIGILGGTFNPIHNAHIRLAELAKEKLNLDKVMFIPAYVPPHKNDPDIIDSNLRYEMVKIAIEGKGDFAVSDVEIRRKGTSYSVDTLKALKERFGPEAELFFITGSDSLSELHAWKSIEEIFALSHFIVAKRPGYPLENIPDEVEVFQMPEMEISSSDIRKKVKQGQSIEGIVPTKIIEYIRAKALYR